MMLGHTSARGSSPGLRSCGLIIGKWVSCDVVSLRLLSSGHGLAGTHVMVVAGRYCCDGLGRPGRLTRIEGKGREVEDGVLAVRSLTCM